MAINITKYIRQFNTFIYSIILFFILSACSENRQLFDEPLVNGCLKLQISINSPISVTTRGADNDINSLTVFIFSADSDGAFYGSQSFSNISSGSTLELNLPDKARNDSFGLKIIAVANSEKYNIDLPSENININYLQKKIINAEQDLERGLIMYGESSSVPKGTSMVGINLSRSVAKISLKFQGVAGYEYAGFSVRTVRTEGFLDGSINPEAIKNERHFGAFEDGGDSAITEGFIYPSEGPKSGGADYSYVILKATKFGVSHYYRLDLLNNDSKEKLDLLANHYYEIVINKINADGFNSAEEAALYPSNSFLEYIIKDHSANILSIASDGIRELGVSNNITIYGNGMQAGEFSVRLGCSLHNENCSEIPDIENVTIQSSNHIVGENYKVEIISGNEWLQLNSVELLQGNLSRVAGNETSEETYGKIWKYSLSITPRVIGGTCTGIIRVSWMGLTRNIKVTSISDFTPDEVCTTSLSIINNDLTYVETYKIDNYWKFLSGVGTYGDHTTGSGDEPALYGISNTSDKIRNQGLHFPICYGKAMNDPWEYQYEFNFSKLESVYKFVESIEFTTEGDPFFSYENLDYSIIEDKNIGPVLTLKLKNGKTDFTYATGTIIFTIKFYNGESMQISFSLYHTGFFHFAEEIGDASPGRGYYYYEVIEMNGEHWLDRNIRAKSNGLYIEDVTGSSIFTTETSPFSKDLAKGALVNAPQGIYNDSGHLFAICPPGYRVPTEAEWNKVINSAYFHNELTKGENVNYYNTYFNSPIAGPIYFPRSRYLNNNVSEGESQTGYYWTQTASSQSDKDNNGKHQKCLYLNGKSSSFINGDVENQQMSLRCIAYNGLENEDGIVTE